MTRMVVPMLLAATLFGLGFAHNQAVAQQSCREDCLDDFGMDLDECMFLPPDEQPQCMEDAANALVFCLEHCTNQTEVVMDDPKYAAVDLFLRACNQTCATPTTCVYQHDWLSYWKQYKDSVIMVEEAEQQPKLAWIKLFDQQHEIITKIVISNQEPGGQRQICLNATSRTVWVVNGTCVGDDNLLCPHSMCNNNSTQHVCPLRLHGETSAFCTNIDDSSLFYLMYLVHPAYHTVVVVG